MTGHAQRTVTESQALRPLATTLRRFFLASAGYFFAASLIFFLLAQLPVSHSIDIGGRDAAYVQAFGEGLKIQDSGLRSSVPFATSDERAGSARWTRASSVLLLPLAGEPAEITLRLQGWPESITQPRVSLWLNGSQQLDDFIASADWQERRVAIRSGQLKLSDFFIEIRSETMVLPDGQEVGVLLDHVAYRVNPPTMPAPSQLLLGGLAGTLLFALRYRRQETTDRRQQTGDNRQETTDRRQQTGDRRQQTGDRRQQTGDRRQQTGDKGLANPSDELINIPPFATKTPRPLCALRFQQQVSVLGVLALIGLGWLLLYRMQPPLLNYPWRSYLMTVNSALAGLVALRYSPGLAQRFPALLRMVLPALVIGGWLAAILLNANDHVTLARPGVENDFRVFATRESLAQIFSADGFYNLGYPLLLWLLRPLYDGNAFLAARLAAALSGGVLLVSTYLLARCMLQAGAALVALLVAALSTMVAQYALYVGSDMPFAACVTLCIALIAFAIDRTQNSELRTQNFERTASAMQKQQVLGSRFSVLGSRFSVLFLAGVAGGCAFLMRHLGLVLLPWGVLVIAFATLFPHEEHEGLTRPSLPSPGSRLSSRLARLLSRNTLAFVLGFVLAMLPQLIVNTTQTGQPLYSQQAKNIWFAVYAGSDWARWDEAPNDIALSEIVLQDPPRFFGNWYRNVIAFFGSGGEDTSEFGRAIQLRLLGFPANWLAVAGMLAWIALIGLRIQDPGLRSSSALQQASSDTTGHNCLAPFLQSFTRSASSATHTALLLFVALYVLSVSVAFVLDRFFLPLVPIYAVAAGWIVGRLAGLRTQNAERRTQKFETGLLLALVLAVVLWGGFANGVRYVLGTQPADEVAAIELVQANVGDALLATRMSDRTPLAKYSALAHRIVDWPGASAVQAEVSVADIETARLAGARFLLWEESFGTAPLPDPDAALIGSAGRYRLYRL
jgi:hypothetical protein